MLEDILASSVERVQDVDGASLSLELSLLVQSIRHVRDHDENVSGKEEPMMQMPSLKPALMWPGRHARVAQALADLQRIDTIELNRIKRVRGKQVFVFDVFLKRKASRIPTQRFSRAGSLTFCGEQERALHCITPDYQLEKTQRDIAMLQYYVWVYAQQAAAGSCAYCSAFFALTEHKYSTTRLRMTMMWPDPKRRKALLEGMINDMVQMCVEASTEKERSRCCAGFENIPPRLHQFTRKQCGVDRLYSFV